MKAKKNPVKLLIILVIFLLTVFTVANYWTWTRQYRDRVYPGVKLGELDLSGKTLTETENLIAEKIKIIEAVGLNFQYNEKVENLPTAIASFDSDLSQPALSFEIQKTALSAFRGRVEQNFLHYLLVRWRIKQPDQVEIIYHLDQTKVKRFLDETFSELNIEPANAYFSLSGKISEAANLKSNPEKLGKEINYEAVWKNLNTNLSELRDEAVSLTTRSKYPAVKLEDLSLLKNEALKIAAQGQLTLRFQDLGAKETNNKYWTINPERLITWASAARKNNELFFSLDRQKIEQYLAEVVAPEINLEAIQPRFEINNEKVTSWQTGKDGRELDLPANALKISEEFIGGQREIDLSVKSISAEELINDQNLKIKEVVGTGHSNFSGSPVNRRHNIKTGADALHGLLIKPDEEFSLLKALGEIDGTTGYRTELVIKGNKTVPEYGGGLCQIGTTIFRTALASGLPITMRQNHSYRVSYYEPAGTDATIYDPAPDFRFLNDTGNYILIQARIDGNDLYFDLWGTKDGRTATTTAPVIYNIVKPAPTKLIETDTLAPGEKKCTESSHNGADAYFDYIVTYPAEATTTPLHERRFTSHYIPWQAVCLVGKTASASPDAATSTPAASSAASSTPAN